MIIINDVSRFSDVSEIADAMQGKYAKDYQQNYKLTIIKNICFVNTVTSCTISNLPDHYAFTFHDDGRNHDLRRDDDRNHALRHGDGRSGHTGRRDHIPASLPQGLLPRHPQSP